jgi:hypothetical protein
MATSNQASSLQGSMGMKRLRVITVGILAALALGALSGCGVGYADDPEGQAAADGQMSQQLPTQEGDVPTTSTSDVTNAKPTISMINPILVALPQDPVPARPGDRPPPNGPPQPPQ